MTKTHMFAARIGGDHVPDLHFIVGDYHPIDQQLHQLTSLLEGGSFQSTLHSSAEILYGTRHAS